MADGIVIFAFGSPATCDSNIMMRDTAMYMASKVHGKLPIYTQPDISISPRFFDVTYIKENPGEPSPTLRLARAAIAWAQERKIDQLYILAARPHLWRCQRDLKMAMREVKANIQLLTLTRRTSYFIWFRKDSTQPRTRSFRNWIVRETILCLMPFIIYKIVAK